MIKNLVSRFSVRQLLIGIGSVLVVVAVVVAGMLGQAKTGNMTPSQESAYANVLKDSLSVYYARYQKYPESYPALLGDIQKTPEIYGVNDEGMAELSHIEGRLGEFSYAPKAAGKGYEFTYKKTTGSTMTVRSE